MRPLQKDDGSEDGLVASSSSKRGVNLELFGSRCTTTNEWSREFRISLKGATNPLEDILFVTYIEEQQMLDVAAGALIFESRSQCSWGGVRSGIPFGNGKRIAAASPSVCAGLV